MSDDSGLDPNTFPIFGLFSFILFMTPVLKWIYVNVMREYERFLNAANLVEDDEEEALDAGGT